MEFLYKILRFTRYNNRSNSKRIIIIYIYFESQFRINFIPFYKITNIQNFIDQLKIKKHIWYEAYQYFRKKNFYPNHFISNRQPYKQRVSQPQRIQFQRNSAVPSASRDIIASKLLPGSNAYYIDPHEQTIYVKHENTVSRGYPSNPIPTDDRRISPITVEDDDYDYNNNYEES